MRINSENEYQDFRAKMEIIIEKGTRLGDMELLSEEDKQDFVLLSRAIAEYEAACHPLPGKISTLLTDTIREKMEEKGVNQKQAAKLLGISESRVSDLLNGKRKINFNIAKRLRNNFGIPADFIFDYA